MGRGQILYQRRGNFIFCHFSSQSVTCREVSGWLFARNCGVKWEKTNYIRNIPVHIRKPGVLPCLFCCSYVYTSSESAKRRRQIGISHLIFYQNLYLSYLWGVWVDLSLLCWGVFLARYREINIKWQKRFYEELLPFYCFCNGGEFINCRSFCAALSFRPCPPWYIAPRWWWQGDIFKL